MYPQQIANPNPGINKNLTCTRDSHYRGFPVQSEKGWLIQDYLQRSHETLQLALKAHPRTLAIRVDLTIPEECTVVPSNAISRFFDQLKRIIQRHATTKNTGVRYVWVRERKKSKQDHYHVMLFLNRDVYRGLGNKAALSGNMAGRIKQAWGKALRLFTEDAACGVTFPANGVYTIRADDPESQAKAFHRLSYLCKSSTKHYGEGKRNFNCSRG